jgi:CD63 antigen
MVEGGMKCVKYLLFAFNFIFFLIGLALMIIGGIVLGKMIRYNSVDGITSGPVFIIVVGAIILVVTFFGCCGAFKENSCMLGTFAVLVGIIFALEVISAIVAFAFKSKSNEYIGKALQRTATEYMDKNATDFWDDVQRDFECCGIDNATTWENLSPNLPDSCCVEETEMCGKGGYADRTDATKFHQKGCLTKLENWINSSMLVVAGVALGLAFVELLGIVLACCMCHAIRKDYNVV